MYKRNVYIHHSTRSREIQDQVNSRFAVWEESTFGLSGSPLAVFSLCSHIEEERQVSSKPCKDTTPDMRIGPS
jgi:hypothetical protein